MHEPGPQNRSLARAWILLCLALALHVFDEATTGFLRVSITRPVIALRERLGWWPMPTFRVWGVAGRPDRGLRGLARALGRGVAGSQGNAGGRLHLCDHHAAQRRRTHARHDFRADGGQRDVSPAGSGILVIADHGSRSDLLADTTSSLASRTSWNLLEFGSRRRIHALESHRDARANPAAVPDLSACHLEFSIGFDYYNLPGN